MARQIELDAPSVSGVEKRYLTRCVESGFVSTFGPFVGEFEGKFARFVGVSKAVSLQSGTAAIHMALHELGIGRNDEVIVPVLTFVATVNPVIYVGATPVFADVDIGTWNISCAEIEKAITKKTKAILVVHLFGNPCDMGAILKIARRRGLYVIEDATESLGARYKNAHTGTLGDMGCFSFNGNKVITTGGGGMIAGRDGRRLDHIKFLVNQARDAANGYYHPEIGFNYRMTNLEAALGLAQMSRLNEFLKKKKRFNNIYREELKKLSFIRFQEQCGGATSSYWLSTALFADDIDIGDLQSKLKEADIPVRRIFMPLIEFPPYKRYRSGACENAYHIYDKGLCLPSSTLNTEDDIYHVCKTIKKILMKRKGGG